MRVWDRKSEGRGGLEVCGCGQNFSNSCGCARTQNFNPRRTLVPTHGSSSTIYSAYSPNSPGTRSRCPEHWSLHQAEESWDCGSKLERWRSFVSGPQKVECLSPQFLKEKDNSVSFTFYEINKEHANTFCAVNQLKQERREQFIQEKSFILYFFSFVIFFSKIFHSFHSLCCVST